MKGINLPWFFIIVLIFLIILFVILLIWNITGFQLSDIFFKNLTSDLPSNISGGRI